MSNRLHKSARFKRHEDLPKDGEPGSGLGGSPRQSHLGSAVVLSPDDYHLLLEVRDAYLAEHPADDDKPITEEWIIKVYGRQEYWPTIWLGANVNIVDGSAWCNGRNLCDARTRGDVRRICALIGIELKESKS